MRTPAVITATLSFFLFASAPTTSFSQGSKDAVSSPYRIGIFPFGGDPGQAVHEEDRIARHLHASIQKNPALILAYCHYDNVLNEPPISNPGRLWVGSAVVKKPNMELVYAMARERNLDGIVMGWMAGEMQWNPAEPGAFDQVPIELYMIDVARRKLHHREGLSTKAKKMTKQVFADFLKGRPEVVQATTAETVPSVAVKKEPARPISAVSTSSPTGLEFPTRAFRVQGGAIALQGGVMGNPEVPAGIGFGNMRYPTRYFVTVINETDVPVWADIEWYFPKKSKKKKPKKIQGRRLDPSDSYMFFRNTFGVIADQAIPIKILVYADEARMNKLGQEETFLYFGKDDKEAFLAHFAELSPDTRTGARTLPVISGWPEMTRPSTNVPGTQADAELQRDIQRLLWKEQSKEFRDCVHKALRAEPSRFDTSVIVAGMPPDGRTAGKRLYAKGDLFFEKWLVESCNVISTYEVALMRSPAGGTDIFVEKIAEKTAGATTRKRSVSGKDQTRTAKVMPQGTPSTPKVTPEAVDTYKLAILPWDLVDDTDQFEEDLALGLEEMFDNMPNVTVAFYFHPRYARRIGAKVPRIAESTKKKLWVKGAKNRRRELNLDLIASVAKQLDVDAVLMYAMWDYLEFQHHSNAKLAVFLIDIKNKRVLQHELDADTGGGDSGVNRLEADAVRNFTAKVFERFQARR